MPTVRVPASSANLGPGFDVLALALDLHLEVTARESQKTAISWVGEGMGEVPLDRKNLIVRAAQEPFSGWARPLAGVELEVHSAIPAGRGLGSSAAAIAAGVLLGARLRRLRMTPARALELGLSLEGHPDNLAAALHGGFCVSSLRNGGSRVNRLRWPPAWRAVLFIPGGMSETAQARRLVPRRIDRADAVFNLGRVAEWVYACARADDSLLAGAMEDRIHQPARARAYPYLDDVIAAALEAGALGAALSGAGGSVIAFAERRMEAVGKAMVSAAGRHRSAGRALIVDAAQRGASMLRR